MKITLNHTLYHCDFCKKKLFRKHAMEKHEKACGANPENKHPCHTCSFFAGKPTYKCTALDIYLYSKSAKEKGLLQKYPEMFEEKEMMPFECDKYKDAYPVEDYYNYGL